MTNFYCYVKSNKRFDGLDGGSHEERMLNACMD